MNDQQQQLHALEDVALMFHDYETASEITTQGPGRYNEVARTIRALPLFESLMLAAVERQHGEQARSVDEAFTAKLERQRDGIVDPVKFERGVCHPEGAKLKEGTTFDTEGRLVTSDVERAPANESPSPTAIAEISAEIVAAPEDGERARPVREDPDTDTPPKTQTTPNGKKGGQMPARLEAAGLVMERLEAWVHEQSEDASDALVSAWDAAREIGAV